MCDFLAVPVRPLIQDLLDEVTRDSPLNSSFTTLSPGTSPLTRKSPRLRQLRYHDDSQLHPTTPTQPFRVVKRRPPQSKALITADTPQGDFTDPLGKSHPLVISVPLESVSVGQTTPTGGHMTNHVITLPEGLVTSEKESAVLQRVLQPLTATLSCEAMQELVESITPDVLQALMMRASEGCVGCGLLTQQYQQEAVAATDEVRRSPRINRQRVDPL